MSAEDYIRGLADADLKRELDRRNDEAHRRYTEEINARYRAEEALWDERRREFCAEHGITMEQYDLVLEHHDAEADERGWH